MLGEATRTLPKRYQKVVVLYYSKEMMMKEIGAILVDCFSHFVTILRRTSVYFQEKGVAVLA
jgi:hypothetical protein